MWFSATTAGLKPCHAGLRGQPLELEQPRKAMLAAALTEVAHVQPELSVAIDTAALQSCLFEQAPKPLVVLCPRTLRRCLPHVVAAGEVAALAHAQRAELPRMWLGGPNVGHLTFDGQLISFWICKRALNSFVH